MKNNRKARYTVITAIAAVIAALVERKRRADKSDDHKRRIPHRRNSAVHLYDGTSLPVEY